jgi:DNA-binding NarL/FixJ family response regulator
MSYVVQILVVEDFGPYRNFITLSLAEKEGFHVVSEATDGLEAVDRALELKPDLILLDIGLPKLSGLEAARRILTAMPQSKIIFLTQETTPDIVSAAFGIGACGYVAKSRAASDLLPAMQAVLDGKRFVSPGLVASDL